VALAAITRKLNPGRRTFGLTHSRTWIGKVILMVLSGLGSSPDRPSSRSLECSLGVAAGEERERERENGGKRE
jgi:hypothetical protein